MSSIPLNLVTGFLGSGKTSFILHYLDAFSKEKKIAVIQNEFAPTGVDGEIIRQHEGAYRLLEVNNGSVFCVCLLGSFVESLAAFLDENSPDEIIMEASGMSDPLSIGQIFQSPGLKNKVYLGNTWSVVDARNFDKVKSLRLRLEHQIRISDTVLVNKIDLAEAEVDKISADIKKINPYAGIIPSEFARIVFNETKSAFRFFPSIETGDTFKPDLQSTVIKTNKMISPERLNEFIVSVKENFIRLKGFVNTGKDKKSLVQLTFGDYTIEEVEWFAGNTELAGIGNFTNSLSFTKIFERFCEK